MSDNNWPDPARPGVPLNPERDGWHWVQEPGLNQECALWLAKPFLGTSRGCWETKGTEDDWQPREVSNWHYLSPCLTPAEVDARLSEARRVALGECISICNAVAHANRVEYPAKWKDRPEGIPHDWQQAWETCAETAEDIAAAIRALGEKECKETES
jgi:hypothetical protein